MNKLGLILTIVLIASAGFIYFQYFSYRIVSLASIEENPQSYNMVKVTLYGRVIENEGMMFGPKYELAEDTTTEPFDIKTAKQIALSPKGGARIDLENYVSYTTGGVNFTEIDFKPVVVKGTIIYIGQVTDSPEYYLDLESIEIMLD